MEPEWRDVVGYEGLYQVCSDGRVRSLPRRGGNSRTYGGQLLAAGADMAGYPKVALNRDHISRSARVHVLVAAAFLGPRADGMEIRHLNGVKTDNRLENLAYGSSAENMQDTLRLGRHPQGSKTHCPKGHPYSETNTRVYRGFRYCLTCDRVRTRRRGKPVETAA